MKNLELYIHIPFCKSKCYYCDFCSVVSGKNINNYMDRLVDESVATSRFLNDYSVDTVFIGGGTPTILPSGLLESVYNKIIKNFNHDIMEFTIEANPDTITNDKLSSLRKIGANRLSIGVQSFNDDILKMLNRPHTSIDAVNAIKLAKEYFNNISCDIMIGLPNQNYDDLALTINRLTELGIKHISCYTLQLEDKTVLKQMVDSGKITLPNDEDTADMYQFCYELLQKNGYNRYEISNFAQNGYECKHNLGYWTRENYLGLGASSHSLVDNIRFCNTNNINNYISGAGYQDIQHLSVSEQIEETIMLNLRTKYGIDIANFNRHYDIDFFVRYNNQLRKLKKYLDIANGYVKIKEEYFEISNSIILEFME